VTGLDISTKMMARLRAKKGDVRLVLGEGGHIPFADDSFDGVLFVHILHLVPDAKATVREALRVVRPGGVIVESRDDARQSRREDLDRIVRDVVMEMSGVDMEGWKPYENGTEMVEAMLRDAGAEVARAPLASWSHSATGRGFLERLKRRDYSGSWKIPDEIFDDVVERVTPMIDEHLGGLDVEFDVPRSISMLYGVLP
jgi:SAM-dependent methyltransferase